MQWSNHTVFELKHFLSPSLLYKHTHTHIYPKKRGLWISISDDRRRVLLKSLTFKSMQDQAGLTCTVATGVQAHMWKKQCSSMPLT